MSISDIFSPIAAWIRSRFLSLSKVDGKPGLTRADFDIVVGWVSGVSGNVLMPGRDKAAEVASRINAAFGHKIPSWAVTALVRYAYDFAVRKGIVKE